MWRRSCLILTVVMALTGRVAASLESGEVNLDYVIKLAEERARHPFHSPRADLPKVLRQDNLDYDKYRQIRFRRSQALWRVENLPFRIEFFHPGYLYQEPVHVYEFTATHLQPIRFVQDFFDYGGLNIENEIPANTGYAGFRVLYQLNETNQWDELGAFLGASYFRLLGKDQRYGQSARGLAVDCGEMDRPEEFPIFTDWWLGKPQPDDKELTLFGLLDSVSCTGAYQFIIHPGETTTADVEAVIFLREPKEILEANPQRKLPVKTIGMAPLTSMFWYGKNSERKFDDYRQEVHDADGLLVRMGNGESALAAAGQSGHPAAPGFLRTAHPWVWPAAAGTFLCGVSGHVQPFSNGTQRVGRAARRLGRGRFAPGRTERQLRRFGQHRRVLGSEK